MDIVTQIVVVLQAVIIIVQPHYPGLFILYLELEELYLVLYVYFCFLVLTWNQLFFVYIISRTNSAITDSGFLSQSSLSSPGSRLLQTSSTGSLNKLPGVSGADKINLLNGGSYKATGGLDNKLVVSNIFYGNYWIFYCNSNYCNIIGITIMYVLAI